MVDVVCQFISVDKSLFGNILCSCAQNNETQDIIRFLTSDNTQDSVGKVVDNFPNVSISSPICKGWSPASRHDFNLFILLGIFHNQFTLQRNKSTNDQRWKRAAQVSENLCSFLIKYNQDDVSLKLYQLNWRNGTRIFLAY
jgi:hypothetical protein